MAKKATNGGQFVNFIAVANNVNAVADNVVQFPTTYARGSRVGIILHGVEYIIPDAYVNVMDNGSISMKFGLSFLENMPAGGFMPDAPGVLDYCVRDSLENTAAGPRIHETEPIIRKDFSFLPGGGLLAHPAFLYFWVSTAVFGAGLAAEDIYARLAYSVVDLADDLYRDIIDNIVTQGTF